MRIGVLGINHKLADLKLRETLAIVCQRCFSPANSVHSGHHLILLSTCNRTEVYFTSDNLADTHSYLLNILRTEVKENVEQKLYSFFGYDCFLHLARVTTGLDSAVIAETEIQGQVKGAYEFASDFLKLPAELHYLFQKSLKIGKQLRSTLSMRRGVPDLEHAVYSAGTHFFSNQPAPRILFVGASEINRKILHYLKSKEIGAITICNRTQKVANDWAALYGINRIDWKDLSDWHSYDWIIFGTKSAQPLINCGEIPDNLVTHKLLVDLSVPRNVDPSLSRDQRITLLNIDQINRSLRISRRRMIDNLIQVETHLAEATRIQVALYQEKESRRYQFVSVA